MIHILWKDKKALLLVLSYRSYSTFYTVYFEGKQIEYRTIFSIQLKCKTRASLDKYGFYGVLSPIYNNDTKIIVFVQDGVVYIHAVSLYKVNQCCVCTGQSTKFALKPNFRLNQTFAAKSDSAAAPTAYYRHLPFFFFC